MMDLGKSTIPPGESSHRRRAVIGSSCCGCGVCVFACPTGAIAGDRERGWRVNPRRCVGCESCADVCRAHAITLREEA